MSLWEYANPVKFLGASTRILPFIAIGAAACLSIGLVWGIYFTPDDYRQGSTAKIIYLHVPSALMAINAWFMMLVASLVLVCGANVLEGAANCESIGVRAASNGFGIGAGFARAA